MHLIIHGTCQFHDGYPVWSSHQVPMQLLCCLHHCSLCSMYRCWKIHENISNKSCKENSPLGHPAAVIVIEVMISLYKNFVGTWKTIPMHQRMDCLGIECKGLNDQSFTTGYITTKDVLHSSTDNHFRTKSSGGQNLTKLWMGEVWNR